MLHSIIMQLLLTSASNGFFEPTEVAYRGATGVMASAQRRGIRELKNLPAASKAFAKAGAGGAVKNSIYVPGPISATDGRQGSAGASSRTDQASSRQTSDGAQSKTAPTVHTPRSAASHGTHLAKVLVAVGVDLHGIGVSDIALGFLQRALAAAPKDSSLAAEVMGNTCVVLNNLGRHADALKMAEGACEMLKRTGGAMVQRLTLTLSLTLSLSGRAARWCRV
jgi:hypothetical protein